MCVCVWSDSTLAEYPYLDDSSGQRHFVMQYNSEFLVVVYSPVPFSARAVVAGEYVGYNVYQDKPHSWALIKVVLVLVVCFFFLLSPLDFANCLVYL